MVMTEASISVISALAPVSLLFPLLQRRVTQGWTEVKDADTTRHLATGRRTAAVLATTAPWWLVRLAHAARQTKLVVWNPAALAPQVDKIIQEQCYAYAKQAGIKEDEIDYSVIGGPQILPKLVASSRPGIPRISPDSAPAMRNSIARRVTSWK